MARGDQGARTRLTIKRRVKFIEALAEMGNVQYACDKVGCSRTCAYETRKRDPEFAADWNKAIEASADKLEQEAWRRAHEGVEEPVFHKGEVCGVVKKYSDVLLIFLLKGLRPAKYRERREISGDKDNPLVTSFEIKLVKAEKAEDAEDMRSLDERKVEPSRPFSDAISEVDDE